MNARARIWSGNLNSNIAADAVKQHFEATATAYYRDHSGEVEGASELREAYLAALEPHLRGEPVLDVACGPGNFAQHALAQQGGLVVAVDFSRSMINEARRRYPGVSFVIADARRLPFRAGAFGVSYSFRSLQHVPGLEQAVAEMRRVTRPSGAVLFDFINRWNPLGLLRDVASRWGLVYLRALSARRVRAMCRSVDLEIRGIATIQAFVDSANTKKYFGARGRRWIGHCLARLERVLAHRRFCGGIALRRLVTASVRGEETTPG
ncbi:MAG: class I SAM-dependent methyltransferase [Planctomycetota bacterium]